DSSLKPDMEQQLRSASSVDELMSLIYPSYWTALKCRSKLSAASRVSPRSQSPLRPPAEEPTFAAAYLNLDVLKKSEWRKTQCMPREVCVDVGREFGAPTNIFYKPPCVSVYRCGGCCHSEDKQCRNISTGYLSKTVELRKKEAKVKAKRLLPGSGNTAVAADPQSLFEITVPITQGTKPVTISVANHTQCSCLSKLDVYKQDKELDVETCQCVCRRGDKTPDCSPNRHFDRNTCRCVCSVPPSPSCPQNHVFQKDTCQCTCSRTCPRHQPLNRTKCSCECNESPNKCFLRGRRFHQNTCR
ncbi:hypothetical protein KUCAC02_015916, partial [Chaenocephalus aceratus]